MRDSHDNNHEPVILNPCDDAEVADSVSPQSFQVPEERLAETTRVFSGRDSCSQIAEDLSAGRLTQLAQISGSILIEFNAPNSCG
jgi:hypothetical protein